MGEYDELCEKISRMNRRYAKVLAPYLMEEYREIGEYTRLSANLIWIV